MTTILLSIKNDKLDTTGVHTVVSSKHINETTTIELVKMHPDLKSIKTFYCGHDTIKIIWTALNVKSTYNNIQLKLT